MERESYVHLLKQVAEKCRVSQTITRQTVQLFTETTQHALALGYDIHIEGLCTIQYVGKQQEIYANKTKTLAQLLTDMRTEVKDFPMVSAIVVAYCTQIKYSIELGKRVNLKGLFYVQPKETDDFILCDTRLSAVLKKPDICTFFLLGETGVPYLAPLEAKEVRLSVNLCPTLSLPESLFNYRALTLATLPY